MVKVLAKPEKMGSKAILHLFLTCSNSHEVQPWKELIMKPSSPTPAYALKVTTFYGTFHDSAPLLKYPVRARKLG